MTDSEITAIARLIDHAVLHPTSGTADLGAGIHLACEHNIAALCVKPCDVVHAAENLAGTNIAVCAVTSFPHGNSSTRIKLAETLGALDEGATEIDTVVNNGLVRNRDWTGFALEIEALANATRNRNTLLKVIFETDYLDLDTIARLTDLCCKSGADFVKISTGFGYVKQPNGYFNYRGATVEVVQCMLTAAA